MLCFNSVCMGMPISRRNDSSGLLEGSIHFFVLGSKLSNLRSWPVVALHLEAAKSRQLISLSHQMLRACGESYQSTL